MNRYDPDTAPPAAQWLALDEQERIILVRRHHERARVDLPNPTLHAVMHAIVENQLAEAVPEVVEALERLRAEGLDRHDALHAIGSVLAHQIVDLMQHDQVKGDLKESYLAELSQLTAARWRAS